ncbi:hypothetical protein AB0C12_22025 [Actinoplanes sp. NPDC048967]|uniref:hypothetical protein n=1 Tax=Actinoplanes sp. NPDC048967 TaxID=3155269 RepID=UPI0033E2ABB6
MTTPTTSTGSYADRYLCSAVHLSDGFAGYVLGVLTGDSLDALGPSPGMDLVALARHADLAVTRHRRQHGLLAGVLAGTLALTLPVLVAGGEAAVPLLIMVLLGGWIAGFAVLLVHRLDGYRRALAVRDDPAQPRDLAPPLDGATEAYLASVMTSNVVVFSGGEPFVGSGALLARWKLNINCTRPAQAGTPVRPFTAADLHKDLTLAARRTGIPGLDVHNRLFVAGTAVGTVPGLHPDPMNRPRTSVSPAALRAGIDQPQPTTRTYLCLRKVSWGGDLVVEVFVRVERTAAYLFVEHHAFVLLPLRAELCVAAYLPSNVAWRVVLRSVTGTLGELLRSPGALLRGARGTARRARAASRQRKQARRSPIYDYGAGGGLRSDAASAERIGLFQYADEDRDLGILRQAMLESIFDFLSAHGIDTSEFTRQQTSIVNQSISIGSITNGNTVIGANGTVVQQPSAAVPGQPTAAPWAPAAIP